MPKLVDKDAMRGKILEAAFMVFAQKGYHAAKMTDIATGAGLAKGTLYLYFNSKEALTSALMQMVLSKMEAGIVPHDTINSLDDVLQLLAHAIDTSEQVRGETLMFFEVMAPSLRSETVTSEVAKFFDRIGDSYGDALEKLKAKGEVRGGIDTAVYGRMIASLVDGMVTHRAIFNLPDARYKQMQDAALNMLEYSLRG